jgi:hypothetical protein
MKKMFISLCGTKKRSKEKPPGSLAFGCPLETFVHGGVKNSSVSADSDSLPPCIRAQTFRSAAMQRD